MRPPVRRGGGFELWSDAWLWVAAAPSPGSLADSPEMPLGVDLGLLRVGANCETASGGVVWMAGTAHERHGATAGQVWVSGGGAQGPVRADVVADPHVPTFFSERSTLPISQVREVLNEFVTEDSGERPRSVSWVAGRLDGSRMDESRPQTSFASDDPWG
ncbi:Imm1 family immunity protein [Oerskovia sp. NPDC060287]|uniref:Imm1 family immunity protein n=1 Tax=Oerskovia sp. NPDC060287 TaxID=3347095 RepID=UPI003669E633